MENRTPMEENPLVEALKKGLVEGRIPTATSQDQAGKWSRMFNPNYPEADWDVSGIFVYDKMLWRLFDAIKELTGRSLFSTVHGCPLSLWNGGRSTHWDRKSMAEYEKIIYEYVKRKVAVELTFTNYNIDAKVLQDVMCNEMLDLVAHHNYNNSNGIIVSEELLADYAKDKYPGLKLVASVVKVTKENGRGNLDYYLNLEKKYDKIMLHPDDNLNPELLQKIENKDKYTLLVNEPCIRNCQIRKQHYQLVSDGTFNILDSSFAKREEVLMKGNRCQNLDNLLFSGDKRTLTLSALEIKNLYDLGFRHFKIQGRGMVNDAAMLMELHRIIFNHDPEYDNMVGRWLQKILTTGGKSE